MKRLKMLCTGEYDKIGMDAFAEYGDLEIMSDPENPDVPALLDTETLKAKLADVDVFICGYEKITDEVLTAAPELKLILSVRDGPEENIDVAACERLGIPVISSAGRCATSVAELTVALMMLCARPIVKMTNTIHEKGWTKENGMEIRTMYSTFSTELFGKTVGVIGLGRNGYQVAKICQAFTMHVVTYDPYVDVERMVAEGFELMSLPELMSTADYVVVLARLTPETEGMVSREMIGLMKPTAALVNTGRGKLIDNDALLDALEVGAIRMAALDAFPVEPLGEDSRFLSVDPDRLILTPHMAGKTAERNWHQYQLLLTQFKDFIAGNKIRMPYTPRVAEGSEYATRGGSLFGTSSSN